MFEIYEKYVKNTQRPCKHKKRNIHTWECMTDIQPTIYIYMQVKALEEQEHAVGKGGVHDIVCWWCQQKRSQRKMIQLKLSASVNRSKLGAILNIGWKCAGEQQPGKNKIKWMVGSFFFHLPTEIANN